MLHTATDELDLFAGGYEDKGEPRKVINDAFLGSSAEIPPATLEVKQLLEEQEVDESGS